MSVYTQTQRFGTGGLAHVFTANEDASTDRMTKWSIYQARKAAVEVLLKYVNEDIEYLTNTPFGKECSGCGKVLETEADFAKHYTVSDPRYFNLGTCPDKQN